MSEAIEHAAAPPASPAALQPFLFALLDCPSLREALLPFLTLEDAIALSQTTFTLQHGVVGRPVCFIREALLTNGPSPSFRLPLYASLASRDVPVAASRHLREDPFGISFGPCVRCGSPRSPTGTVINARDAACIDCCAFRSAANAPSPAAATSTITSLVSPSLESVMGEGGEIDRDLLRSFPSHPLFMVPEGTSKGIVTQAGAFRKGVDALHKLPRDHGLRSLRNVLCGFALLRPDVAYCQGINTVAAALLCFADDAERSKKETRRWLRGLRTKAAQEKAQAALNGEDEDSTEDEATGQTEQSRRRKQRRRNKKALRFAVPAVLPNTSAFSAAAAQGKGALAVFATPPPSVGGWLAAVPGSVIRSVKTSLSSVLSAAGSNGGEGAAETSGLQSRRSSQTQTPLPPSGAGGIARKTSGKAAPNNSSSSSLRSLSLQVWRRDGRDALPFTLPSSSSATSTEGQSSDGISVQRPGSTTAAASRLSPTARAAFVAASARLTPTLRLAMTTTAKPDADGASGLRSLFSFQTSKRRLREAERRKGLWKALSRKPQADGAQQANSVAPIAAAGIVSPAEAAWGPLSDSDSDDDDHDRGHHMDESEDESKDRSDHYDEEEARKRAGKIETQCVQVLLSFAERLGCDDMWRPSLPRLQVLGFQLSYLLRKFLPSLSDHFSRIGFAPEILAAQFLVPLLSTTLPLPSLARVYDLFLLTGSWKILFRVLVMLLARMYRLPLAEEREREQQERERERLARKKTKQRLLRDDDVDEGDDGDGSTPSHATAFSVSSNSRGSSAEEASASALDMDVGEMSQLFRRWKEAVLDEPTYQEALSAVIRKLQQKLQQQQQQQPASAATGTSSDSQNQHMERQQREQQHYRAIANAVRRAASDLRLPRHPFTSDGLPPCFSFVVSYPHLAILFDHKVLIKEALKVKITRRMLAAAERAYTIGCLMAKVNAGLARSEHPPLKRVDVERTARGSIAIGLQEVEDESHHEQDDGDREYRAYDDDHDRDAFSPAALGPHLSSVLSCYRDPAQVIICEQGGQNPEEKAAETARMAAEAIVTTAYLQQQQQQLQQHVDGDGEGEGGGAGAVAVPSGSRSRASSSSSSSSSSAFAAALSLPPLKLDAASTPAVMAPTTPASAISRQLSSAGASARRGIARGSIAIQRLLSGDESQPSSSAAAGIVPPSPLPSPAPAGAGTATATSLSFSAFSSSAPPSPDESAASAVAAGGSGNPPALTALLKQVVVAPPVDPQQAQLALDMPLLPSLQAVTAPFKPWLVRTPSWRSFQGYRERAKQERRKGGASGEQLGDGPASALGLGLGLFSAFQPLLLPLPPLVASALPQLPSSSSSSSASILQPVWTASVGASSSSSSSSSLRSRFPLPTIIGSNRRGTLAAAAGGAVSSFASSLLSLSTARQSTTSSSSAEEIDTTRSNNNYNNNGGSGQEPSSMAAAGLSDTAPSSSLSSAARASSAASAGPSALASPPPPAVAASAAASVSSTMLLSPSLNRTRSELHAVTRVLGLQGNKGASSSNNSSSSGSDGAAAAPPSPPATTRASSSSSSSSASSASVSVLRRAETLGHLPEAGHGQEVDNNDGSKENEGETAAATSSSSSSLRAAAQSKRAYYFQENAEEEEGENDDDDSVVDGEGATDVDAEAASVPEGRMTGNAAASVPRRFVSYGAPLTPVRQHSSNESSSGDTGYPMTPPPPPPPPASSSSSRSLSLLMEGGVGGETRLLRDGSSPLSPEWRRTAAATATATTTATAMAAKKKREASAAASALPPPPPPSTLVKVVAPSSSSSSFASEAAQALTFGLSNALNLVSLGRLGAENSSTSVGRAPRSALVAAEPATSIDSGSPALIEPPPAAPPAVDAAPPTTTVTAAATTPAGPAPSFPSSQQQHQQQHKRAASKGGGFSVPTPSSSSSSSSSSSGAAVGRYWSLSSTATTALTHDRELMKAFGEKDLVVALGAAAATGGAGVGSSDVAGSKRGNSAAASASSSSSSAGPFSSPLVVSAAFLSPAAAVSASAVSAAAGGGGGGRRSRASSTSIALSSPIPLPPAASSSSPSSSNNIGVSAEDDAVIVDTSSSSSSSSAVGMGSKRGPRLESAPPSAPSDRSSAGASGISGDGGAREHFFTVPGRGQSEANSQANSQANSPRLSLPLPPQGGGGGMVAGLGIEAVDDMKAQEAEAPDHNDGDNDAASAASSSSSSSSSRSLPPPHLIARSAEQTEASVNASVGAVALAFTPAPPAKHPHPHLHQRRQTTATTTTASTSAAASVFFPAIGGSERSWRLVPWQPANPCPSRLDADAVFFKLLNALARDLAALDERLRQDGVALSNKVAASRQAWAEARKSSLQAEEERATTERKMEALKEQKARLQLEFHGQMMLSNAPSSGSNGNRPSEGASASERAATLRSFSSQISALDASLKEATAQWKKAAWQATLASTREEELRGVSDALVVQLIELTNGAEADKRALMQHLHRALTTAWRRKRAVLLARSKSEAVAVAVVVAAATPTPPKPNPHPAPAGAPPSTGLQPAVASAAAVAPAVSAGPALRPPSTPSSAARGPPLPPPPHHHYHQAHPHQQAQHQQAQQALQIMHYDRGESVWHHAPTGGTPAATRIVSFTAAAANSHTTNAATPQHQPQLSLFARGAGAGAGGGGGGGGGIDDGTASSTGPYVRAERGASDAVWA